ncbi:hypothetical protein ACOME3_007776 [Neoechinorhynchus agilis]
MKHSTMLTKRAPIEKLKLNYLLVSSVAFFSGLLMFHLCSTTLSESMSRVSEYALSPGLVRPEIDDTQSFDRMVRLLHKNQDQMSRSIRELNRTFSPHGYRVHVNDGCAHVVFRAQRLMSIESMVLIVPFRGKGNLIGMSSAFIGSCGFGG